MRKKVASAEKPEEGQRKGFVGRAPLSELHCEATKVFSLEELRHAAANAVEGPVSAEHVKDVLCALPKTSSR